MLIIICITILAYMLMGKNIKPLIEKLKNVNWKEETQKIFDKVKEYAVKGGRVAAKPILQLYYVLNDANTTTKEKALIYAAIIYTVMPFSLIPQSVFKFLGVLDEGAALLYVYQQVKDKITPEIDLKVQQTLDDWFGSEYETYTELV